jgi:hypothetical protein
MGIGQELLDVPFPEMIFKMANAIAQGQRRLDKASLETTRALAKATVSIIPELYEVITPTVITNDAEGNALPVPITGANVRFGTAQPVNYTLIQAGLFPTFYQFTESIIEVKISISHRTSGTSEFEFGASLEVSAEASGNFLFGSASVSTTFSSHVNYKSSNSYSYSAEGSSLLRTTLKPVPPPARLIPRIVTVDATKSPPTVTFS